MTVALPAPVAAITRLQTPEARWQVDPFGNETVPVPPPLEKVTCVPSTGAPLTIWAVQVVLSPATTVEGEQERVSVGDASWTDIAKGLETLGLFDESPEYVAVSVVAVVEVGV